MRSIPLQQREQIIELRQKGHSILEIVRISGSAQTTVQRHVKGVGIPQQLLKRLREKQGGAKERATGLRTNVMEEARERLGKLDQRDEFLILAALYWGEGTKRDFSVINSDPLLIQTIIHCLRTSLNIPNERMWLSLRIHRGINVMGARRFWSKTTGLAMSKIIRIEIVEGKKKGKLPYGMCRVRVQSGIRDRLILQSAISLIGKEASERLLS